MDWQGEIPLLSKNSFGLLHNHLIPAHGDNNTKMEFCQVDFLKKIKKNCKFFMPGSTAGSGAFIKRVQER